MSTANDFRTFASRIYIFPDCHYGFKHILIVIQILDTLLQSFVRTNYKENCGHVLSDSWDYFSFIIKV